MLDVNLYIDTENTWHKQLPRYLKHTDMDYFPSKGPNVWLPTTKISANKNLIIKTL
jgi:hypothetical protein